MVGHVVDIEIVGSGATIPRPPKPARTGDTNPAEYIPQAMTEDERRGLRTAAQEFAGTLGGFVMRNASPTLTGPIAEHIFDREEAPPDGRQAAEHMNHFLNGEGEDLQLDRSDLIEIRQEVGQVADFENTQLQSFLELVRDDFAASNVSHRQYLIKNVKSGSPNYGENWFALTEEAGEKWFYALGAFWISYGAHAFWANRGQWLRIHYRMYIYDRYNWDPGKETRIPTAGLSQLMDADDLAEVEGLNAPDGYPYLEIRDGAYVINDAFLGSLTQDDGVNDADAHNYDITGDGQWRSVTYYDLSRQSTAQSGSNGSSPTQPGRGRQ